MNEDDVNDDQKIKTKTDGALVVGSLHHFIVILL
jgi:hypothetical protein